MGFKGKSLKIFNQFQSKYPDDELLTSIIENYIVSIHHKHKTWKYLDWLLKVMLVEIETKELNRIDPKMYFMEIEYFHEHNDLYTTKNLERLSLIGVDNSDIILKNPKDINSYDFSLLVSANGVIKHLKKERENEKIKRNGVDVVYEGDDYLIITPLTHEASIFWGMNTKWCTAMNKDSNYYKRYTSSGSLFYVIDKYRKDERDHPFSKFAIYIRDNNANQCQAEVYNAPDDVLKEGVSLYLPERIIKQLMSYHLSGGLDYNLLMSVIYDITKLSFEQNVEIGSYNWILSDEMEENKQILFKSNSFNSYRILLDFNPKNQEKKDLHIEIPIKLLFNGKNVGSHYKFPIQLPDAKSMTRYLKNGDIPLNICDSIERSIKNGVEMYVNLSITTIINLALTQELTDINEEVEWIFKTLTQFTDTSKSMYANDSYLKVQFSSTNPRDTMYGYTISGGINYTQNIFYLNAGATDYYEWDEQQQGFIQLYRTEDGYRQSFREFTEWCVETLILRRTKKITDVYNDNINRVTNLQKKTLDEIFLDDILGLDNEVTKDTLDTWVNKEVKDLTQKDLDEFDELDLDEFFNI